MPKLVDRNRSQSLHSQFTPRLDLCMATTEESQIKILSDSVGDNSASQALEQVTNEKSCLLHKQFCCWRVRSIFKRTVCLKSKAIVLILLWSLLTSVLHWMNSNPSSLIVFTVAFVLSHFYLPFGRRSWSFAILAVMGLIFGIPSVIGIFLYFSSIVAFNANVIQFGLDQLHDSPTEHLVLYIHWYVLLSYAGTVMIKLAISILGSLCFIELIFKFKIPLFYAILGLCFIILLLSLCIGYRKFRGLFLPDSGSGNPYKLVYRLITFARKHKTPIQRSAFTYCEEELPSRLDLGKKKYGGPFTVEEVENVKVLLGILRVLLSLGPLFSVERSINVLLPIFSIHLSGYSYSPNCVTPLII